MTTETDIRPRAAKPIDTDTATLDARSAAALLRVSRATLCRWIADGTIRSHKLGGRRLFLRDELLADVASRPA